MRAETLAAHHSQLRPADPDLERLDRRITALEDLGDARGRRLAVFRLRRRWQHLDRDKGQQTALWLNEVRTLTLAVDREEGRRAGNFYVIHTSNGQAPDTDIIDTLCDGDQARYIGAACGIDTRRLYTASLARPVPFRPRIARGHYVAALYQPTRRERIKGWWQTHRWALIRNALLAVSLIVAYLALNAIIGALVSAADWALRP